MDQISAWELDDGIQKYQVKKFQIIADKSKENTTITQNSRHCKFIISKGKRWTIAIATQIPHNSTHKKFIIQESRTAFFASIDFVYITGATAFAVSWNQLINSNIHTKDKQIIKKDKVHKSIKNIFIIFSKFNIHYN